MTGFDTVSIVETRTNGQALSVSCYGNRAAGLIINSRTFNIGADLNLGQRGRRHEKTAKKRNEYVRPKLKSVRRGQ
jgi:hypothetical protein